MGPCPGVLKGIEHGHISEVMRLQEKQKPFYLSPAPFSAVALSTTAILLVLSVIFYILWKLRRARQKAEMLADPRVRMRNLLENNERLELLEQLLADRREGQAQMQLM